MFRFPAFLHRVYKTTRDYIAYLRQSHIDLIILTALVLLILASSDGLVMWLLRLVSPALATNLEKLDRTVRMLLFGVLPATILFIIGIMKSGWLALWQQNRLEAETRNRAASARPLTVRDVQVLDTIRVVSIGMG